MTTSYDVTVDTAALEDRPDARGTVSRLRTASLSQKAARLFHINGISNTGNAIDGTIKEE